MGTTGVSGSVNAGKSNINSTYTSVTEQSGFRAGDGGFNVNVQGNTTLVGGAITSTQTAVEQNLNRFQTGGTLTVSDLHNQASYSASSSSVNLGTGFSPQGKLTPQGTSAGFGKDSGQASSVTQSAISGMAGNTAARTGDAETGIKPIFDADRVQKEINAQTQITQLFGQQASKAIGDYAEQQKKQAQALRAQAEQERDPQRAAQLKAQAQQLDRQWGDNGTLRLAAHTVVGALTGGAGGAAGAAAGTLTAPAVAKALQEAQVDPTLAQALTALASTAVGTAVGGSAGGVAALNEVANNYLSHAENEARLKAARECKGGNQKACEARDAWDALDRERDEELKTACFTDGASAECSARYAHMQNALSSYSGKRESGAQLSRDIGDGLYPYTALAEKESFKTLVNVPHYDAQAIAKAASAINVIADLMPLLGDVKAFVEANTKLEYALAAVGVLGPLGDAAKIAIKDAKILLEAGETTKAAEKVAEANHGLINASNRLIKEYVDDIEKQTGYRLNDTQRAALANEMRNGNHAVKLTPAENAALRTEFNSQRVKLIGEWERQTGQKWPTVVIDGVAIPAQAHHVIPVTNNGPTAWWNITPAMRTAHQALHAPGRPLRELQRSVK